MLLIYYISLLEKKSPHHTVFMIVNYFTFFTNCRNKKVDKDKEKYFKREKSDVHTDLHITIDQVCGKHVILC